MEHALAGSWARLEEDLAVGHDQPINTRRLLHDCHEFVFHFRPFRATPLDRRATGVRYQDRRTSVAGGRPQRASAARQHQAHHD